MELGKRIKLKEGKEKIKLYILKEETGRRVIEREV